MGALALGLGNLAALVCDDDGYCYDNATQLPDGTLIPGSGSGVCSNYCPPGTLQYPDCSCVNDMSGGGGGGGFDWGKLFTSLANQWTAIGGRVIAPQTSYTRDSHGNIVYSTPGSGTVPGSLISPAGGSSSLLWIGIAVVGVVVVLSLGKKH